MNSSKGAGVQRKLGMGRLEEEFRKVLYKMGS